MASSLAALDALVDHSKIERDSQDVSMICLFDHEEVGS
jgi:aspartyl aminopeptidase